MTHPATEASSTAESSSFQPPANAIKTAMGPLWLGQDGLLRHIVLEDRTCDLAQAKQCIEVVAQLAQGRRLPLLIDIRRQTTPISREGRHYFASEAHEHVAALAFLVDSQMTRLMANFFLVFNKPRQPTRMFNAEQDAITWLESFQDAKNS